MCPITMIVIQWLDIAANPNLILIVSNDSGLSSGIAAGESTLTVLAHNPEPCDIAAIGEKCSEADGSALIQISNKYYSASVRIATGAYNVYCAEFVIRHRLQRNLKSSRWCRFFLSVRP